MTEDIFVATSFGKIHVLKQGQGSETPLIFIHGMLGQAENWLNDFKEFMPRPCVAISLRGRGQSDFPERDFSVEDHADDIKSVVEYLGLKKFILVGFSQGALYSMAYALKYPDKIAGLIIQDKTLSQGKFTEKWIAKAKTHSGFLNKESVLWGLSNSSRELDLLPQCYIFAKTPTLIIKAGKESMLNSEGLQHMSTVFKNSRAVIFSKSGHDVSAPDYELYISTMKSFLKDFGI